MKSKQEFFKRRNLLKDAQNIKKVALQCLAFNSEDRGSSRATIEFIWNAQRTAQDEFALLDKLFETYQYDLILEDLFHCRVEYLITVVSFLIKSYYKQSNENNQGYADIEVLVPPLFKVYRVIQKYSSEYEASSKLENDVLSITNTISHIHHLHYLDVGREKDMASAVSNEHASSWYDVCFTTLTILLVKVFSLVPQSLKFVNVLFGDAVQLCQSHVWQVQYFALGIVLAHVLLEEDQQHSQFPANPSDNSSTKLPKSATNNKPIAGMKTVGGKSKPRRPANSSANKVLLSANTFKLDELFRNGFLRTLASCCLHRIHLVRQIAAHLLNCLLDRVGTTNQKAWPGQFTSSAVEQGVVLMWEYVCRGIVINDVVFEEGVCCSGKQVFPEPVIREVAARCLQTITLHLAPSQSHPSDICSKLFASLSFSGNYRLRLNILADLLCLALVPLSATASIAEPLRAYVMQVGKDIAEMQQVVRLVYHVLDMVWKYQQFAASEKVETARDPMLDAKEDKEGHSGENRLLAEATERIQPILLVGATSSPAVKMVCPPIATITSHCPTLSMTIQIYHTKQLSQALHAYATLHHHHSFETGKTLEASKQPANTLALSQCEKEVAAMLNNLPETAYYYLEGSYALWQEVFSHMTGAYVLNSSVQRMSLDSLLELLHLAGQYDMPHLRKEYVQALLTRISLQTTPLILQYAIQKGQSSSRLQLALCVACIRLLCDEMAKSKAETLDALWQPLTHLLVVIFT